MSGGVDFNQLCVISSVQVCGLVSAALARITEGRRWQEVFQRMFIALLVIMAFTTVLNVWNAPQQWMRSATTLALMVVTVTCDFSRPI
jgi:cation transport ATPase